MNYEPRKENQPVIMKTGKKGIVKRIKYHKEIHKPYMYIVEIDGKEVPCVPSDFRGEG